MRSSKMDSFLMDLENNIKVCRDQLKEFERKDVKYEEDLKHLKQKIKKLEVKVEKNMSKIDKAIKEMEESSSLMQQLEGKMPILQELFNEEDKVLQRIKETSREEIVRLHAELTQVRTELEPWENQIIEHKGVLDVTSAEKELMQQQHYEAQAELSDAQTQMETTKEKIKKKESYIMELQDKIETYQSEANDARKVELESIKQEELLAPMVQEARQKLADIQSAGDSKKNQASGLKAILQAMESNEIQGVYGRLGDLGAIDGKYLVAMSTACSGFLDYILVETVNSAQTCIELLRRRNCGEETTCLVLDKQTHLLHGVNEKVNTPEGVPRLFDLVKVKDEKLKLAFYSVLGNTLVANNLDQASRIAYGSAKEFRRVVTLNGELFETSGTMSGGGNNSTCDGIGTSIRESVSEEATRNAESDVKNLVEELIGLRVKVNDAKKRYRSLEEANSGLEMELAKARKEVESMNMQYCYNKNRLKSLEAANKITGSCFAAES